VSTTLTRPPRAVDDLWLRECHGFRVDSPRGRIGLVEDVLFDDRERVSALRIAAGMTGRRMLVIDANDVACIYPSERRLRMHAQPTVLADYRGDGHPSHPHL
jgi:hypothetical protein